MSAIYNAVFPPAKPEAKNSPVVLYAFREGLDGFADVVTRSDKQTIEYHLTQDQVGVLSMRKGSPDGPVLAFIRIATPVSPASVSMPSSIDREKGLAWSTTFTEGGVYQKKWMFEDRNRFKYSFRNVGTALPASSLELWSETLNKRIATFQRPIYTPQDRSCRFELEFGFAQDADFFLASSIAMEELDGLKRGTKKPVAVETPDPSLLPTYDASTNGSTTLSSRGSIKK